jgi:hypothetical protein
MCNCILWQHTKIVAEWDTLLDVQSKIQSVAYGEHLAIKRK